MKHRLLSLGSAALLSLCTALPSVAQSTQDTDLEARIAALENRPKLSFGVAGVELTIYGYIKADFIYDVDSDLGTTFGGLGAIVPGAPTGRNFRGQAIQSRIGFKAKMDGATAVIEGDFFGGGGGTFRLRHAYVDVGDFKLGRSWTNFMPIESYPSTLDFQGPAGIPFARVTQARYTNKTNSGLGFSVSVEQSPSASADPAITGAVFYSGDKYFVKLAAVGTKVKTAGTTINGSGVNLSGNANLWDGGTLNASFTTGQGIGSYMVYGGSDIFGGAAVDTDGVTLGVSQKVNDWTFGLVYGLRRIDQGAPTSTKELQTVYLNAKYQIRKSTSLGLEYITGTRDLFNGTSASADRLQASVQFNF